MAAWFERFLHAVQDPDPEIIGGEGELFLLPKHDHEDLHLNSLAGSTREGGQGEVEERCPKGAAGGRSSNHQSWFAVNKRVRLILLSLMVCA